MKALLEYWPLLLFGALIIYAIISTNWKGTFKKKKDGM